MKVFSTLNTCSKQHIPLLINVYCKVVLRRDSVDISLKFLSKKILNQYIFDIDHNGLKNLLLYQCIFWGGKTKMDEKKIERDNIELILQKSQFCEEKDQEFLNSLWKYALFSKSISRTLPTCLICDKFGEFEFEGLGGIKKVGNGIMYIPITDQKVYAVPDILFHYFFIHNVKPTDIFRDAVIHSYKPNTNQYGDILKEIYYLNKKQSRVKKQIRCSNCGELFEGYIAYKLSRKKEDVQIYKNRIFNNIFNREQYIGVCIKCLHYSVMDI